MEMAHIHVPLRAQMNLHPSHPVEQRSRELDIGFINRVRTLPLYPLELERAAHRRLFHGGEEADGCWRCRVLGRDLARLVQVPR